MRRVRWVLMLLACLALGTAQAWAQSPDPGGDTVSVTAFGKKYSMPVVRANNLRMIEADSWRLKEILDKYGASVAFDADAGLLTVTRGDKIATWKAGEQKVLAHDSTGTEIQGALLVQDGKPWLPLLGLSLLVPCKVNGDPEVEIDPLVTDIRLEPDRSDYALHVESSAPLTMKTLVLKSPDRFVVDIPDAGLDIDHFGTTRNIDHPSLGQIRFSQFSLSPNVVRIVIPLKDNLEVEPLPQSTAQHLIMALRRGNVADLGQNFDVQKVTNVTLDNHGDGVTLALKVTGPVQLEWHRLRPPDNRIFVDVPDAILATPKQTLDAADGWTNDVTVSQFQVTPRPIVRVVFNMARPAAFDIKAAGQGHDDVRLSVHNQEVGMTEDTLSGLKVNALPSRGATVVIDPGHGGSDCGAENRKMGMNEKTFTLAIALRLAQLMKKQGWNVFLTRDRDRDVTSAQSTNDEELGARCKIANDLHADLFVSIHCDASVNKNVHGTSVHWYKPSDLPLARAVMTNMTKELGCNRRGCEYDRLYVLRHTRMPAILVETAFITNPQECRLLNSGVYQQKQASSIFHGLRAYVAHYGSNFRSAKR